MLRGASMKVLSSCPGQKVAHTAETRRDTEGCLPAQPLWKKEPVRMACLSSTMAAGLLSVKTSHALWARCAPDLGSTRISCYTKAERDNRDETGLQQEEM